MNVRTNIAMLMMAVLPLIYTNGQKNDRPGPPQGPKQGPGQGQSQIPYQGSTQGPIPLRDRIMMKLDSIDHLYLVRLRPREMDDARRKLDGVAQLVDRLDAQVQDREKMVMDREQLLRDKERDLQDREQVLRARDRELQDRERDLNDRMNNDRNRNRNRDRDRDNDHDMGPNGNVVRVSPMSPPEFDQLMEAVQHSAFDQDKKKVIRTASVNNFFMIDQVIKMASKCAFDKDRLEIIQILYPRILDLDKNYLLYNCFTFSDSKNKLEQFIRDYTPVKH
jgi:hypothetical protein